MTNWNDIAKIRRLDELCKMTGFTYKPDGYGSGLLSLEATAEIGVFARDASLYSGDVDDLINWLHGWERAHMYLNVLGAITPKIIERKKLDYRNKCLVKTIKGEKNAKTEL